MNLGYDPLWVSIFFRQTFGNAAMIIASAEGALFISAQAHRVGVYAARISVHWVQAIILMQG